MPGGSFVVVTNDVSDYIHGIGMTRDPNPAAISCVQGVVADDLIPCDNGVNFRSTINQYSIEGIVPDDRSSGDGYA